MWQSKTKVEYVTEDSAQGWRMIRGEQENAAL